MSKLTLDALKERANEINSEELMAQISGGTEGDCHPEEEYKPGFWTQLLIDWGPTA